MIKIFAMTLSLFAVFGLGTPASAQEEDIRPRMYVGRYIQLDPIMAPFRTTRGVRYEVVTVRLVIGENSTVRPACFVAPKLHEEIMFYLWERGLTTADFSAERLDGLGAEILDFVRDETDERYYSAVELAGGYDEIDEDSQNLSNLCK
jgi:hypothetical protein